MNGTEVINLQDAIHDANSLPGQIVKLKALSKQAADYQKKYQAAMDEMDMVLTNIRSLMTDDVQYVMISWRLFRLEKHNQNSVMVRSVRYQNVLADGS